LFPYYLIGPGVWPEKTAAKEVLRSGAVFEATLSVFTEKFSKCRSVKISNCLRPTGRVFEISAKAFAESVKTVRSEKTDPDRRTSFPQTLPHTAKPNAQAKVFWYKKRQNNKPKMLF